MPVGRSESYVAEDAVKAEVLTAARRLAHPAMESLAMRTFPEGRGAIEPGPVGLRIHRAVKAALDPAGILNPGKVLAPDPVGTADGSPARSGGDPHEPPTDDRKV